MILTQQQKAILLTDGCRGMPRNAFFWIWDRVELFARDDDSENPTVSLHINGEDSGQNIPRVSDYPIDWRKPLMRERAIDR